MSISTFIDDKETLLEKLKKRPDLVGLQHTLEQLEKFVKFTNEQNYPPTSIEKKEDNTIVIYMALAGFSKSQLSINLMGPELIVRGEKDKEEQNKVFIQKGIAFRSFEKKFLIGSEAKVLKVSYKDGLISIFIYIPSPNVNDEITNIEIKEEI
jgi:HSP20 family molecular chaperone IbpA